MLDLIMIVAVLMGAYLLGSIPTALIVSRKIKKADIRCLGDGNMGAHNTFHEIGPKFGIIVAIIDFSKGALAVFLAYILDLNLTWQILTAVLVIMGHDFPLFAHFKGGQGMATSLGIMLILFPFATLIGLIVNGITFLIIKNFNVTCGIGGAVIALILGFSQQWLLLGFAIIVFLFILVKMFLDKPRRRAIGIKQI